MKKDENTREFNMEMSVLPWEMVLFDVPEPDPGKMDFRQQTKEDAPLRFREPAVVTKLIDHLNLRKS
jgi:hypothetical protein